MLGALFGGLDGLTTHDGLPVIENAGPGHKLGSFYRARVFQDDRQLEQALVAPESELGPPPKRKGRAGRLNAAGVSIFYGADTVETAIAEVRPPVGSRVLSASFEVTRPIRLLDIQALKSILVKGSLFDPDHRGRLEHAAFLESFSSRFSQPVMPDHETFEYVPTQAVADFIANEVSPEVDGILYPSPQTGGRNVALFHRSSAVEQRLPVHGSDIKVLFGHQTEEGYETEYTVFETVPRPDGVEVQKEKRKPEPLLILAQEKPTTALRLALDTLTVHAIPRVEIKANPYRVARISFIRDRGEEDF